MHTCMCMCICVYVCACVHSMHAANGLIINGPISSCGLQLASEACMVRRWLMHDGRTDGVAFAGAGLTMVVQLTLVWHRHQKR